MHLPRRKRVDTGELQENWQPTLYGRLIALGLLIAYAIAVHFVFITASVSLVWLVLLAVAIGLVAGILLAQLDRRRRRRRAKQ